MLALVQTNAVLDALVEDAQALSLALLGRLQASGQVVAVPKNADLLRLCPDQVLCLRKGVYKFQVQGKTIRLYAPGDWFRMEPGAFRENCDLSCDFAGETLALEEAGFRAALDADPALAADWMAYQALQIQILQGLCAIYCVEQPRPQIELREFSPGQSIIEEGSKPREIFEMVEGSASVRAQGLELGRIRPGEIFGELSFFTGGQRSASVIAQGTCLVQVMGEKDFLALVRLRPQLVESLIRGCCSRLLELNEKLLGREGGSGEAGPPG